MLNPHDNPEGFVAVLAAIGASVGIGKLLNSAEPLSTRAVLGRALVNAGIGAAAGATSLVFTTADPLVMYGVASGLASLGTSAIESIIFRRPHTPTPPPPTVPPK